MITNRIISVIFVVGLVFIAAWLTGRDATDIAAWCALTVAVITKADNSFKEIYEARH